MMVIGSEGRRTGQEQNPFLDFCRLHRRFPRRIPCCHDGQPVLALFLPGLLLLQLLVPQHPPQHLSHQRLRELAAEFHFLGDLELRELLTAEPDDLLGRGGLSFLEHD